MEKDNQQNKKMLLIYNPLSGRGQIRNALFDIIDILVKRGYEITVHPTQERGDATVAVRQHMEKYDCITCCGGDGTLDEVVAGMMEFPREERVPVGYIPAGSTNDFANSLGISKDMIKAAKGIVSGKVFSCDMGIINQQSFVYIAAFGIFTDVSYETKQEVKNVLGHTAYVLEGMKRLGSIRSVRCKVTTNGEEIEDDFIFGMITNSTSVGGFKGLTGKHVALSDGEFEVTLVKRPRTPAQLNNILAAILISDIDADNLYQFKASSLTVEGQEEIAWTVDGEFGGRFERAYIENAHRAIDIIAPIQELV